MLLLALFLLPLLLISFGVVSLIIIITICVVITKTFFFLGISESNVTIIVIGNIKTVIAFEKIDNKYEIEDNFGCWKIK